MLVQNSNSLSRPVHQPSCLPPPSQPQCPGTPQAQCPWSRAVLVPEMDVTRHVKISQVMQDGVTTSLPHSCQVPDKSLSVTK